ncbi:PLP-dependent aminotransferase family protein [bacterium]|nr:PLP-dependent aminotransferase family protein [bacterium]
MIKPQKQFVFKIIPYNQLRKLTDADSRKKWHNRNHQLAIRLLPFKKMNPSGSEFLYRSLAREIGNKIRDNTYKLGERLPSTRELHKKLNLSISTVYKAYIELEKQGLIEARPKSGYFVRYSAVSVWKEGLSGIEKPERLDVIIRKTDALVPHQVSLPSFVNHVLKAVKHPDFLQLGSAMLSPELLPYRQFNRIMKDISPQSMQAILSYNLPQGDLELRRQLALRSVGILDQITAADLVITNGCTEGLSLSLRAITRAGDVVAIESPAFYGILPVLEELDLLAVEVPSDPVTGLDLDCLEAVIQKQKIKACLLTPNFSNPQGSLMPDAKKRELVRLLSQHEIPLIEDSINTELYYDGKRPALVKAFDRKGLVITCSSFSKTLAPGLRIGWIIPGPRYLEAILKLKAGFSVSNASLDQTLVARFMAQGTYERYLRSLRTRLRKQVSRYVESINTWFPEQARVKVPVGGILLWVQLPPGTDGIQVYQKALEQRISILPGVIFSASGQYQNYIRIGCGNPFTGKIEKGIASLGSIIQQLR